MLALGRARLEHSVVDGDVFAFGIEGAKDLFELGSSVGGGDFFEQRSGLRQMLAHGIRQRARRPEKHAGVPEVIARGNELLGPVQVGLLGKAAYVQRSLVAGIVAGLNVAVAGFRTGGLDAQHHHVVTGRGQGDGFVERLQEARLVGDDVIGGKDAQDGIGILAFDEESGQAAGGRGVARHRLLNDLLLAAHPCSWSAISWARNSLVMTQVFAGLGQRLETLDGLLNHGALAVERKNLLGMGAARAGPEAGTAAAGKNHWAKINRARHGKPILPDRRRVCTVPGAI